MNLVTLIKMYAHENCSKVQVGNFSVTHSCSELFETRRILSPLSLNFTSEYAIGKSMSTTKDYNWIKITDPGPCWWLQHIRWKHKIPWRKMQKLCSGLV